MHPVPSIGAHLPGVDPELEQILTLALERDPARRPTAAAMGRSLESWYGAQREFASPDRLQEHLARIFPSSYQARTRSAAEQDEHTSFSALRRAMRRPWWRRWLR